MQPDLDFSAELELTARRYKTALEDRIDSGVPPPNTQATIKKKGHDLTLRDSWSYRKSIELHIAPTEAEVGVFDPIIAEYVFWNEHGTKQIPARPVFGPVADGPGEKFLDELEEALADKIIEKI